MEKSSHFFALLSTYLSGTVWAYRIVRTCVFVRKANRKRTAVARADILNYPYRKGLPVGNSCRGIYAVSKTGPASIMSGLTIAWNCLKLA